MFNAKWLIGVVAATLVTMIVIVVIKKTANKLNIPVVKTIANEV